ncbi:MAG: ABC transporter ATP-binding protein [Oscillospiraceae bacterium]
MLNVQNLTVRYGGAPVVDDRTFSLAENHWLMVVGPNGAGKSSIVNAVSQSIPYTGRVLLEGENAAGLKPKALARKMGVLSQTHTATYSFTVGEIVKLGRYAYAPGLFGGGSGEDDTLVKEALALTGVAELESQSVLALSGGELQRTFLAQVFAQNPKLLILDEPTNHLDLVYQKQIFELVERWVAKPGRSVISVVHDLSLARAYGTEVMLMNKGHIAALGQAGTVLSRPGLQAVYGMDVHGWLQNLLAPWQE